MRYSRKKKIKIFNRGQKERLHNWTIYESKLQILEKEIKMKYMSERERERDTTSLA